MQQPGQQYPQYIKSVEYVSMTSCLKHFRQLFEKHSGAQIETVEVNAAVFLADVAVFIGLSPDRVRDVLGNDAYTYAKMIDETRVKTTIKH